MLNYLKTRTLILGIQFLTLNLKLKLVAKMYGRSVTVVLGIICVILATSLVGAIANYTSVISEKDNTIASLNSQLQQLEMWLDGNRTLLTQIQNWLQGNITYYESRIEILQTEISNLNSQIQSLQEEYDRYVTAYQNLRDEINQRWNQIHVEPFIIPNDQAVRDIVYSITGGWSSPSDWDEYWQDVKAMYNWVVDNIEYRSDGLYPMPPSDPSGDLDFWNEMWQFPNETLSLRKGDCEDMAILLCSMIRCYCDMKSLVECIVMESSTSGHVAVQIPVSGYKLVILDPAGRYYSHDIFGNIVFNDVTTEINNWLDYWKPTMGSDVYVERVFADYLDEKFTSTSEYISWMYSR